MKVELVLIGINLVVSFIAIFSLWGIERQLRRIRFEYALKCVTPATTVPTFIKPTLAPRPGGKRPMKIVTDESLYDKEKKRD